ESFEAAPLRFFTPICTAALWRTEGNETAMPNRNRDHNWRFASKGAVQVTDSFEAVPNRVFSGSSHGRMTDPALSTAPLRSRLRSKRYDAIRTATAKELQRRPVPSNPSQASLHRERTR